MYSSIPSLYITPITVYPPFRVAHKALLDNFRLSDRIDVVFRGLLSFGHVYIFNPKQRPSSTPSEELNMPLSRATPPADQRQHTHTDAAAPQSYTLSSKQAYCCHLQHMTHTPPSNRGSHLNNLCGQLGSRSNRPSFGGGWKKPLFGP